MTGYWIALATFIAAGNALVIGIQIERRGWYSMLWWNVAAITSPLAAWLVYG